MGFHHTVWGCPSTLHINRFREGNCSGLSTQQLFWINTFSSKIFRLSLRRQRGKGNYGPRTVDNKMHYIHSIEYHLTTKGTDVLIHSIIWWTVKTLFVEFRQNSESICITLFWLIFNYLPNEIQELHTHAWFFSCLSDHLGNSVSQGGRSRRQIMMV